MNANAQPEPGDVFKEHIWPVGGGFFRIGGSLTQAGPNVHLDFPGNVDLTNAIKAEFYIEKVQCHCGTMDLQVSVNGNDWILLPFPPTLPEPVDVWPTAPADYQHHSYPTVEIPLDQLQDGANSFRLDVDPEGWWPQNLTYGCMLRVYYDPDKVDHATGRIVTPESGATVGNNAEYTIDISAEVEGDNVAQVDFLGWYDGVNWEGDGIYQQWHYHFYRCEIQHHIGTAGSAPYSTTWNTEWVPDQADPMKLVARIVQNTSENNVRLVTMTDAVDGLVLSRENFGVELCKPYEVPVWWVSRMQEEKAEKFDVTGTMANANAARMMWSAWCGTYCDAYNINGTRVAGKGPDWTGYNYWAAEADITAHLSAIQEGENTLSTQITSPGSHGTEINWPGIQVLIQYDQVHQTEAARPDAAGDIAWSVADMKLSARQGSLIVKGLPAGAGRVVVRTLNGRRVAARDYADGCAAVRVDHSILAPGVFVAAVESRSGTIVKSFVVRP
ncbi:MAG: hypothetical protein GF418_06440 [Chitinivibrionales bacterium]|nr:hypothetical protein [Chitinivibrionales bacterium]MBD3395248.1 hypothetical protein [Chitinivibrionales bacterium]